LHRRKNGDHAGTPQSKNKKSKIQKKKKEKKKALLEERNQECIETAKVKTEKKTTT